MLSWKPFPRSRKSGKIVSATGPYTERLTIVPGLRLGVLGFFAKVCGYHESHGRVGVLYKRIVMNLPLVSPSGESHTIPTATSKTSNSTEAFRKLPAGHVKLHFYCLPQKSSSDEIEPYSSLPTEALIQSSHSQEQRNIVYEHQTQRLCCVQLSCGIWNWGRETRMIMT